MLISVSLSVILTFAFVFAAAYSATTISTSITTAGDITTTGSGSLTVAGNTTMVNASTTAALTVAGISYLKGDVQFNGFATTTGLSGNFATKGTLTVTGVSSLTGLATFLGGATTTSLRVGSGPDVSTVSGLSFGVCDMPTVSVTASSTAYGICTPRVVGSISTGETVFVQATSSLPEYFVIVAASSTAVDTISVKIANIGWSGTQLTGGISLNFIGIR